MDRICEIIFLIMSCFLIICGLCLLIGLFWLNNPTSTQIAGTIFIGGFLVLVGIGGAWASISYMRS